MERIVTGQLNGGGPEISMRSQNGSIYILRRRDVITVPGNEL